MDTLVLGKDVFLRWKNILLCTTRSRCGAHIENHLGHHIRDNSTIILSSAMGNP